MLAVVAVLVTGFAVVNAFDSVPAGRGSHGWRGPWSNQTQTTVTETTIEGVITDADFRYIEIDSTTRLAAPMVWQHGDRKISLFKLFANDLLNIGDRVKLTVVTVSMTRPSGVTTSFTYVKQIIDYDTGVTVQALTPMARQQAYRGNP